MLQIDSIAQVQSLLVLVRPVLIRLLLVPLLQASEHNNDAYLKFPIVNIISFPASAQSLSFL